MAISGNTHCSRRRQRPLKRKSLDWKPLRRIASVLCLTTLFAGCSDSRLENRLNDYVERLERVLEQTGSEYSEIPFPTFPAAKELYLEGPELNIDLFEFLKLGACEIQGVVAEKNSSLGKFAAESIVLYQDVQFVLMANECIVELDDPDLKKTLIEARQTKLGSLDLLLWNAIFAGPEYRTFWTQNRGGYPQEIESRLVYALSTIEQQADVILQGKLDEFDPNEFEEALEVLRSGEAADLLLSWHQVANALSFASSVLQNRLAARPLCFKDMRNPKAEIFRNVVLEKFVGGIQKDVAVMNQRYYDVVQPLQTLEAKFQDIETESYRAFRHERDQLFAHGFQAVKGHVAAIEPLMVQCGFLPGSSDE